MFNTVRCGLSETQTFFNLIYEDDGSQSWLWGHCKGDPGERCEDMQSFKKNQIYGETKTCALSFARQ